MILHPQYQGASYLNIWGIWTMSSDRISTGLLPCMSFRIPLLPLNKIWNEFVIYLKRKCNHVTPNRTEKSYNRWLELSDQVTWLYKLIWIFLFELKHSSDDFPGGLLTSLLLHHAKPLILLLLCCHISLILVPIRPSCILTSTCLFLCITLPTEP